MTATNSSDDPGDVGRRVKHRRGVLGLSIEEVAERSGTDAGYLEYLESRPAQVTHATVVRLAAALQTTAATLLGAGIDVPSGQGNARRGARLETLTPAECRALLTRGGVGRVVFHDARGPVAFPVNYQMLGDDIVFRTASTSSVRAASYSERVSFEVDHIDDAMREGWSVLVTGHARQVRTDELPEVQQLGIEPWAGDERPVYMRIELRAVSGRRIRVRGEEGGSSET
jgi:nitroimidazol reductase NimA-like FMN-containing flavoprotein (pyridoxamine 5'-phosphate oxidase superfamily)